MEIEKEIIKIKKTLDNQEKRISRLEETKSTSPLVAKPSASLQLFKKTGISADKMKEVFDLEGDILTVIKSTGKDDEEKTRNITLLTLIGHQYFMGENQVSSGEIRRNVAENHISLNNFGSYLKKIIPTLIIRKGKPKSPKTSYRLTVSGDVKARELIKNMSTQKE